MGGEHRGGVVGCVALVGLDAWGHGDKKGEGCRNGAAAMCTGLMGRRRCLNSETSGAGHVPGLMLGAFEVSREGAMVSQQGRGLFGRRQRQQGLRRNGSPLDASRRDSHV